MGGPRHISMTVSIKSFLPTKFTTQLGHTSNSKAFMSLVLLAGKTSTNIHFEEGNSGAFLCDKNVEAIAVVQTDDPLAVE